MTRILLRAAQVVTLAPNRPATERIDILIDGDRIAALGDNLDPTGADVVDLTGRIVIPGLVNAHLHTWQTALRFTGADWSLLEYLAHTHGHVARRYRPDDMYVGTLAGALNQINCGTTTLGDWCHNCLTPAHADAAVDAPPGRLVGSHGGAAIDDADRAADADTVDDDAVARACAGRTQ